MSNRKRTVKPGQPLQAPADNPNDAPENNPPVIRDPKDIERETVANDADQGSDPDRITPGRVAGAQGA